MIRSLTTLILPILIAVAACSSTDESDQEKATPNQTEAGATETPTKSSTKKPAETPTETPTITSAQPSNKLATKKPANRTEPDFIVVDHILIAFKGAKGMQGVTRSLAEAKELTDTIVAQLGKNGDWATLKRQFSNDPGPTGQGGGPYEMTNHGAPLIPGSHPRSRMVPAFGNVGFALDVGEIDVAPYDAKNSPYGYHIIKRVR